MRVAHVISSLHPDGGGLPKTAAAMAASLALRGEAAALFFTASPEETERVREAYGTFPGFDAVRIHALKPGWNSWGPSGIGPALRAFRPDVIHTHGLWEPLLRHACRYAQKNGIPYVVFPQSMLHPWQSRHHRLLKALLRKGLGWESQWRHAAFVQVLSEAEAEHWGEVDGVHCRRIPNGIFPEEDMGEQPAELPDWAGERFVLSLARLHPQKSPDLLLQAFLRLTELFPDLQLVLAGPDYGMEASLRRSASQSAAADRIHFPGSLGGRRKWNVLHRCACFVLPSQAEGFSLALLEAALAGVPSVISEGCYFPELVEAGGAVQVELTVESVADGIRRVLETDREMGSRARERVLNGYSWEKITGQLTEAYREAGA